MGALDAEEGGHDYGFLSLYSRVENRGRLRYSTGCEEIVRLHLKAKKAISPKAKPSDAQKIKLNVLIIKSLIGRLGALYSRAPS